MREIWAWLGEWLCWFVVVVSILGLVARRWREVRLRAFWRLVLALSVVHLLETACESVTGAGPLVVDEYLAVVAPMVLTLGRYRPRLSRALLGVVVVASLGRVLGGLSAPTMAAAGLLVGGAGFGTAHVLEHLASRLWRRRVGWTEPPASARDRSDGTLEVRR